MVFLMSTPDLLVIIWAAVFILAAVIEASTMDLQSIWFSVGAFAALLAALFGAGEAVQIVHLLPRLDRVAHRLASNL
ncbi:MAG: hypothetical protein MZU97_21660 [Bacillus subtilis]|nr:hypothetical protein [Bacillus subtilis]